MDGTWGRWSILLVALCSALACGPSRIEGPPAPAPAPPPSKNDSTLSTGSLVLQVAPPEALVKLEQLSGPLPHTQTEFQESKSFEGLTHGTYRVTARLAGYIDSTTQIEVAQAAQVQLSITLEPLNVPIPPPPGPERTALFTSHTNHVRNPERGLHRWIDMADGASAYTAIASQGESLGILVVRLDAFRTSPLSAEFLSGLEQRFGHARAAGIKLVLKFSYNEGPYPNSEPDASESVIIGHIGQLEPLLRSHSDVIAFLQAGFIGAWGEWHTSTNELVDFNKHPDSARNILNALLDALPPERFVQLRYPAHKVHFFGAAPLSSSEAFTSAARARVGHHNDCFLANETDHGTYSSINYTTTEVAQWKSYLAEEGKFSPMGGETCGTSSYAACDNAVTELSNQRFTYLNHDYHPDVIAGWKSGGCFDEIRRRLGYRFELQEARFPQWVSAGAALSLKLTLRNSGFTSPVHSRTVYLVLDSGSGSGTRHILPLPAVDIRGWQPGDTTIDTAVTVPADATPGEYRLSLWLPDSSMVLRERAEYAIQFANVGTWEASTGLNVLVSDFEVK